MDKKKPLPQKKMFDVKVECMLPATITYNVLAENEQQACELIKTQSPTSVKHRLIGRKDIKITVFDHNSLIIRFIKRLLG